MTSQDKENILYFSAQVDKKDLQSFSQASMNQVINLQVENQRLLEKEFIWKLCWLTYQLWK